MTGVRRFLARVAALSFLPLVAIASLPGEPLVSVRTGTFAPLAAGEFISRVLSVEGQLVAFGAGSVSLLDAKSNAWSRKEWQPDGEVVGVATMARGGNHGFLLLASERGGPVTKLAKFSLKDGAPVSVALRELRHLA